MKQRVPIQRQKDSETKQTCITPMREKNVENGNTREFSVNLFNVKIGPIIYEDITPNSEKKYDEKDLSKTINNFFYETLEHLAKQINSKTRKI